MKKILLAWSIISGLVGFVIPAQAGVEISESTIRTIAARACRVWQSSDITERELYNKIYATIEQNSDSPLNSPNSTLGSQASQGYNIYMQYRQQYFEKVSKTIV